MYRRILVGVDGSRGSKIALRKAALLAREGESQLHILAVEEHLPRFAATVGETDEAREEKDAYFRALMEEALQLVSGQGVSAKTEVTIGNASRVIVDRARQLGADLIVIGHTSHVWGNLLGSTADRVVDHAHCDVLVVR